MKSISLITMILLSASALTARADEPEMVPDTVARVMHPNKVVVTENNSTTTITVEGRKDDPDFNFQYTVSADTSDIKPIGIKLPFVKEDKLNSRRKPRREVTFFTDIYCGFLIPYEGPQEMRTSSEWAFGNIIGYRYTLPRSGSAFGLGLGMGTKIFNVRRGMVPAKAGDALVFLHAPEGATDVRSNLESWSLQIPFYYRQKIYRSLVFQISAIANFNFYTKASTKYSIGNVEYTDKVKGLHQRGLTPEFVFTLGSTDFGGVYVRWSPVKMFERKYGPQVSTLSIGITVPY